MPNVTIEIRRHYARAEEEAIIAAVHAALMEGIKIPAWDKTIRLIVHEPHRFAVPRAAQIAILLSKSICFPAARSKQSALCIRRLCAISENSEFLPATSKYCCARVARRIGVFEEVFPHPKSI